MAPLMLAMLVSWYITWRFGADLRSVAARTVARAADKVATWADRVDQRAQAKAGTVRTAPAPATVDAPRIEAAAGPAGAAGASTSERAAPTAARSLAGRVRDRVRAAARWLRSHPTPTTPRTAAGQMFQRAGKVAGAGLGALVRWLRLVWIDAVAAAESAQQRRATATEDPSRRWWTPPSWLSWPTGDDPQAPIWATAEVLDTDVSGDVVDGEVLDTEAVPPKAVASDVVDAEIVDADAADAVVPAAPPAAVTSGPWLSATPVAALPSGGNTLSVDTTAAEAGLESYLAYSAEMTSSCNNAVNSAETTLGALRSQDWSGAPIDAISDAMEHLAAARDAFDLANAAFNAALNVRESYAANDHAGTKESVLN